MNYNILFGNPSCFPRSEIEILQFSVFYGCLPFTSKTQLVSNCANGTNNFDWKIPFGARAFHFPYDQKTPEIYRKGPGARWKTQQNVNGTK